VRHWTRLPREAVAAPLPGSVQGQAGQGFDQPGVVENVTAHVWGVGTRWSIRSLPIFTRIQEGTQLGELTQLGQTEQGIPYHVLPCWVLVWGELGGGNSLTARECTVVVVGESSSVSCAVLCCVFSLSVSLSLLFPLSAVLLNCPYPDPPVFACFFLFFSSPQ